MKANTVLLGVVGLAGLVVWAANQHHELHTEITLEASPEQVWQVLTDTAAYPQWNPVIVRLQGKLEPGQNIAFENRDANGSSMVFRPTVLKAEADRELRWLGGLGLPHIFDGEHSFKLTALAGGRTRLEHAEHFSGLLIPFTRRWLNGSVLEGFERLNRALQARVEGSRA